MKKTVKKKDIAVTLILSAFLLGFSLLAWVKPPQEISDAERRKLKQFPEISWERIENGAFMTDFESYALDQFPLRDTFRGCKAWFRTSCLFQQDTNGIYMADGYLSKIEYPMDESSMNRAVKRFRSIYDSYLKDKNTNVYFAMIPDKNCYLAQSNGKLSMDYDEFYDVMKEKTDFMQWIDISDLLDVEDYYRTDTHWRQEKIIDVAERIASQMQTPLSGTYEMHALQHPFYGVYSGQSARKTEPDTLYYLSGEKMENYVVYDYEHAREIPVYDLEMAHGKDPYEIYLSGDVSLLEIRNPGATTQKELIVFRDSFGSSIAPLLAEGYTKTTLVDIRYISPEILDRYIDFEEQDVLFLYSTLVINNSETIK